MEDRHERADLAILGFSHGLRELDIVVVRPGADWFVMARWFVSLCYRRRQNGQKFMTRQRKPDGRKLTLNEYRELRDMLIRGRWAYWKNAARHDDGWEFQPDLTAAQIIAGLQQYREDHHG